MVEYVNDGHVLAQISEMQRQNAVADPRKTEKKKRLCVLSRVLAAWKILKTPRETKVSFIFDV